MNVQIRKNIHIYIYILVANFIRSEGHLVRYKSRTRSGLVLENVACLSTYI